MERSRSWVVTVGRAITRGAQERRNHRNKAVLFLMKHKGKEFTAATISKALDILPMQAARRLTGEPNIEITKRNGKTIYCYRGER